MSQTYLVVVFFLSLDQISEYPGWHLLKGDILAFVDPGAENYHGGDGIAEDEQFPGRRGQGLSSFGKRSKLFGKR